MMESQKPILERSVFARAVGDLMARYRNRRLRIAERRQACEEERRHFESRHGYPLNLHNPQSFSEKICWRKLYDRNPLLEVVVDKIAVREYVKSILGEREAAKVLVPLLFSTTDPAELPFGEFPDQYIIKANHGSGYNLLVRGDRKPTERQIVERCREWLNRAYGVEWHEWAYQGVERRILVEPLLSSPEDKPPREYKFQMFDGKCALIQALHSETWYDGVTHVDSKMPTLTYFTQEWAWLDVSWCYYFLEDQFPSEPTLPRPAALHQMLAIAEKLSAPFDYIRVDLYDTQDGIRVGELTPYHLTGHAKITPTEFDFELGRKWHQARSRWRYQPRIPA